MKTNILFFEQSYNEWTLVYELVDIMIIFLGAVIVSQILPHTRIRDPHNKYTSPLL